MTVSRIHRLTLTHFRNYRAAGLQTRGDVVVLVGPNVPHNWLSDVPRDATVAERCIVLQFTQAFADGCMALFPELGFLQPLLAAAGREVLMHAVADVAARVVGPGGGGDREQSRQRQGGEGRGAKRDSGHGCFLAWGASSAEPHYGPPPPGSLWDAAAEAPRPGRGCA